MKVKSKLLTVGFLLANLLLVVGLNAYDQSGQDGAKTIQDITLNGTVYGQPVQDDKSIYQDFEIVPNELDAVVYTKEGKINARTGLPGALYGVNYAAAPDAPEAMAAEYLRANAAELGLQDISLNDLQHSHTRTSLSGTTVRFDQYVSGVPVYKSEVIVHLSPDNVVTFVSNDYRSDITMTRMAPTLTAEQARDDAFDYVGIRGQIRVEKTALMVYYNQGETRLAYRTEVLAEAPAGTWEVFVDAHSGEIFKVLDLSYTRLHGEIGHGANAALAEINQLPAAAPNVDKSNVLMVDGTGNIFDPDPLSSAGANYTDPGYSDNNDADSPELNAELVQVTLRDIELDAGTYTLRGPYAEVVDVEGPFDGLFSQASDMFLYNRGEDSFEAVNTYYHIDFSMRYINETLGVTLVPYQYTGGVRFDPHGFNGADNSRYSVAAGDLAFGEGGVDDAEDSDVVHHELGHGLHDWVTNGGLSQVEGLSEGIGDYWAQSYNRSLGLWQPTDPQYNWVFNWDGHNEFWNGRVTDYGAAYPGGLVGQIHTDGQIWATCNMLVWDAIGQTKTDTAFLEGLGMTGGTSSQNDSANAVMQAAIDMGYSPSDLQAMHDTYTGCGYTLPELPVADFSIDVTPSSLSICAPDEAVYLINVNDSNGFGSMVSLSVSGHPANTTTMFDPTQGTPAFTSTLTIGNTGAAAGGDYNIVISGMSPTLTHTSTVSLNLGDNPPAGTPTLTSPADGSTNQSTSPMYMWDAVAGATQYEIEVATDAGFTNIVDSAVVNGTSYTSGIVLDSEATYYWHVRAWNGCGAGSFSDASSFTTQGASLVCNGGIVDFEAGIPNDFALDDNGGPFGWTITGAPDCSPPNWSGGNETPGSGNAACADADGNNNPPSPYDAQMWTNPVSLVGQTAVTLTYATAYNELNGSLFDVDVTTDGGTSWNNLLSWADDHSGGEIVNLDLTPYAGEASVMVRYRFHGTGWDWWAEVDDIQLSCAGSGASADISPASSVISAPVASTAMHPFTVTNNGSTVESFDLSVTGNSWPTQVDMSSTGSLNPGESAMVYVHVDVPVTAVGQSDSFTLMASLDGNTMASATGTTNGYNADDDGVDASVEDAAPNGGDGNNDGIPDSVQASVASFPSGDDNGYVTLEANGPLGNVAASNAPAELPDGVIAYTHGVMTFAVDVEVGGSAWVTVTMHTAGSHTPNSFWKQNSDGDWWLFDWDEDDGTGAVVHDSETIVLHLEDGGRGDWDGVANGVIVDPGAPAFSLAYKTYLPMLMK